MVASVRTSLRAGWVFYISYGTRPFCGGNSHTSGILGNCSGRAKRGTKPSSSSRRRSNTAPLTCCKRAPNAIGRRQHHRPIKRDPWKAKPKRIGTGWTALFCASCKNDSLLTTVSEHPRRQHVRLRSVSFICVPFFGSLLRKPCSTVTLCGRRCTPTSAGTRITPCCCGSSSASTPCPRG